MLTENEIALIKILRNNSRKQIFPAAKQLNIPKSTIFDTLKKLETNNLIYHKTMLNFEKIGYPFRMVVAIKVDHTERESVCKYLEDSNNINNLHVINMGYDFLFEGIFQNQKEAQNFLIKLETENIIEGKQVFNVIDNIYCERFLTGKKEISHEKL